MLGFWKTNENKVGVAQTCFWPQEVLKFEFELHKLESVGQVASFILATAEFEPDLMPPLRTRCSFDHINNSRSRI